MNLTEEQIRAASGRKLDALIDRELFGFTHRWMQGRFGREEVRTTMDDDHRFDIPYFSSSMSTCFTEVIPAMRARGFEFSIEDAYAWPSEGWKPGKTGIKFEKRLAADLVVWGSQLVPFGEEATGICRAALLALLGEGNLAITERETPCQNEERENV